MKLWKHSPVCGRRAMALILTGVLLCTALPVAAFATSTSLQQKVNEAQSEYKAQSKALDAAQEKTDDAETQVSSLNKQTQAIVSQIGTVNSEIDDLNTQIADLNQQIADLNTQISQKEAEITDKQAAYDSRMSDFRQRLAGMQELHDNGAIAMLSSVDNLYELLTFSEIIQDMSVKDNEILTGLQTEKQALQAAKDALDADKASLETSVADLQTKQTSLQEKQQDLQAKQDELKNSLQSANAALTQAQAEEQAQEIVTEESKKKWDKALAEQDAYIKSQLAAAAAGSGASLTCGLNFRNPLDSYKYISTNFGDIDNWHSKAHGGTDFAASAGTPIHAAESGIVIIARSSSSYGNYVVINHGTAPDGNTYATLYAHMTSYAVGVGQSVSKGDVIGYVGSTGRSTGNHLHLELWQNGSKINALSYIPG